jgi:hypothetical protein
VIAVNELAHAALRPSFECAKCGQPWPCAPAKVEMAEEYQDDIFGMGYFLGLQMADAMDQATHNHAWGRVDNLYDRFLGWVPKGEGNPHAA